MNLLRLIALLFITLSCASIQKQELKPVEILMPEISTEDSKVDAFNYKSSLLWVRKLADAADCVVNKKSFKDKVEAIDKFDYSTDNGRQVYSKLISSTATITTYKTSWYSPNKYKVIATTWNTDKKHVYLNLRVHPRTYPQMINTSIHEKLHLDGYSHGDNSPAGKQNSVNYKVGKIAEQEADGCY